MLITCKQRINMQTSHYLDHFLELKLDLQNSLYSCFLFSLQLYVTKFKALSKIKIKSICYQNRHDHERIEF